MVSHEFILTVLHINVNDILMVYVLCLKNEDSPTARWTTPLRGFPSLAWHRVAIYSRGRPENHHVLTSKKNLEKSLDWLEH
jgi:hypothetical protein